MKKTVLFKIWKFPQISETFVVEQIITAIECGFNVQVLIEELQDIKESKQKVILDRYKILDKVIIEDYKIPEKKSGRILKAILLLGRHILSFPFLLKLYREEKQFNLTEIFKFHFYCQLAAYDIIHVQYGTNVKPLDIYKKIGVISSKLVVSFHGHDAFFPINNVIFDKNYYRNLFDSGDLIFANTPYLAQALKDLGCPGEKIKTVPVGVNTSFFTPKKIKKELNNILNMISVGRLDKVKGHRYAVDVVYDLKKKGYPVTLSIVGEGRERDSLQKQIKDKGLDDVVFLLGAKSQEEVKMLLNQHDLYVFPAVPVDNERRETQGLATLEAQACGLPAVVFDSGGVKYTVKNGETGYVVPEQDLHEMRPRIETLIQQPALRIEMGKKAVQFVRANYSQNVLRQKWCEIYKKLSGDEG